MPHDLHSIGDGGAIICSSCVEWHEKAMRMLAHGEKPDGCQECGITLDALKAIYRTGNIPMALVVKDGIYQILCQPCAEAYAAKRRDLYGPTEFGRQKGIQ